MSNITNITAKDNAQVVINNFKRTNDEVSDSSESSISDGEVTKRHKLNYLSGDGSEEWSPSTEWVLEGQNITRSLNSFRKKNLRYAQQDMTLNDVRILSLSFVFPVNLVMKNRSITSYLDDEKANAIKEHVAGMDVTFPLVSDEVVLHCKKLLDAKDPLSIQLVTRNEVDQLVVKLCVYFLKMNTDFFVKSETTFMVKYLVPFLSQVFEYETDRDLSFTMVDGATQDNKKPDFKLALYGRKKTIDFFFVEVKRPNCTSKFQPEDDFVKLLKETKSAINSQLALGIANPISFGLLVEGFRCSLYQMVVVADGVYLPVMVKMFTLVEYASDLMNIPTIVESLCYVKKGIVDLKGELKSRKKNRKEELKSLVKPSYQTKLATKSHK